MTNYYSLGTHLKGFKLGNPITASHHTLAITYLRIFKGTLERVPEKCFKGFCSTHMLFGCACNFWNTGLTDLSWGDSSIRTSDFSELQFLT